MENNNKLNRLKIIRILLVILILACLVSIGAYMRFHKLDAWGFWFDEYLTQDRAHFNTEEIVKHNVTSRSLTFYGINSLNRWAVKKI